MLGESSITLKYKYQGQERQDELGLNWDSFKWRNYDYALGRFMGIDPLANDFPQWSPYVFSGNLVLMARELEGMEPDFMIGNDGKLSKGIVSVMSAAFGYSVESLTGTTWIKESDPRTTPLQDIVFAVESRTVAVTDYKRVAYRDKYSGRTADWWFALIGHEQRHRDDIDNYGSGLFYGSYTLEAIRAGGDEQKMLHEAVGYKNEKYAAQLWNYNGGEVGEILQRGNITDNQRAQFLESTGARFRRDVILNDTISNATDLINNANALMGGLGNSKEDQGIKTALGNMISGWQQNIKDAKKEQGDITKKYGN